MLHRGEPVVRGVHVNPPEARAEEADPGVGGIGAEEFGLPGRRHSFEVATDIPRRQAQRAQAGNLQMREVLAHPPPLLYHLGQRCGHGRRGRIELEVAVDACRQVDGLEEVASGWEGIPGVVGERRVERHQRGAEGEFAGVEHGGREIRPA